MGQTLVVLRFLVFSGSISLFPNIEITLVQVLQINRTSQIRADSISGISPFLYYDT